MTSRRLKTDAASSHNGEMAPEPVASVALRLLLQGEATPGLLVHIPEDSRSAHLLREALLALAPDLRLAWFPSWDCAPDDRSPPSRAVMGARMAALRWLRDEANPPRLVLTTPPALIRRVPPRSVIDANHLAFRVGEVIDIETLPSSLGAIGYILDDRVDEPGEFALRGRVIDLFPAAAPLPCRIEHESGRIISIRSYDPISQRSEAETELLLLEPASEIALTPAEYSERGTFPHGEIHALGAFYPRLETLFDYAPSARVILSAGAQRRAATFFEEIAEAREARVKLRALVRQPHPTESAQTAFMSPEAWTRAMEDHALVGCEWPPASPLTRFSETGNPAAAFGAVIADQIERACVILASPDEKALRKLARQAEQAAGCSPSPLRSGSAWRDVQPGTLLTLVAPLDAGFSMRDPAIVLVTARDVLGDRLSSPRAERRHFPVGEVTLRIGDVVIHTDHGLGRLEGIEEIVVGEERVSEMLRLRYADDAILMVPVDEIGAVHRYGGDPDAVSLDRLKGEAWIKRRDEATVEIARAADKMVALADRRRRSSAPRLKAPASDMARFRARFPHPLTRDQAAAVEAVLGDLASGRPMDRLICGDVGFGKTEIALQAAAAVAFAGRQVAIFAPTTVLTQQHYRSIHRRFAPFGIEVAYLSRLTPAAEARQVKVGLADGRIRVVVGTHMLAGKGVEFADLALVVIDEEQRFGTAQKQKMRALAADLHVLTLTATPIPRTLQASLAGLQELSIIATPPTTRRPVRMLLAPLDASALRDVLLRERRLDGQSFVVCPRIEDMPSMADRLGDLVPELTVLTAHGKMAPAEIDDVMLAFAEGEGDVLLATNIVESGLDVPRANTMLVWRPEQFGLAQLHQLRGRVGRGSRRGTVYLMTDPAHPPGAAALKRLRTLEALDRLGAGFEVSARDLDTRGSGDLFGEAQAGHVKKIGLSLYQRLLEDALRAVRNEPRRLQSAPDLHLEVSGVIPSDYVPEPDMRISLYAQAEEIDGTAGVEAFAAELADRFGPLPASVHDLLAVAGVRALCRRLQITRLDAGPKAIAATFTAEGRERVPPRLAETGWSGDRAVLKRAVADPRERLQAVIQWLDALGDASDV
ncbi:transcription-repair coupling factor (superfamily II helicase) [Rhodoligotrophos appendicifer]|uniref:DEAD/DEAH box helicase n=1 Tax=Rhodoligotrophos appendicifer TaxID=987056 RepID=UPI001FECAF2A|nr:DEAD/DEAH box helicase [Rhodoligotrophos appendicifer]